MDFSVDELTRIVARSAKLLEIEVNAHGARNREPLARDPRYEPVLRRVAISRSQAEGNVTQEVADAALKLHDVDPLGLDVMDRTLGGDQKFGVGPAGIDNLAGRQ